jgi:hypothetical protein
MFTDVSQSFQLQDRKVLLFVAEDGGVRFLHNFDELLPVYTASH